MIRPAPAVTTALILALQACDARTPTSPTSSLPESTPVDPIAATADVRTSINPPFDASNFVATITNPYLPHAPGTQWRLRSRTPDGVEINVIRATRQTKQILGVTVTVIHDQVFLDGELTEDTFDWEAQDKQGNVWYFGEDSKELENGVVVSTEGSWEAGKLGAHPGIIMFAHPQLGKTYIQEDAPDVAEDRAKALSLNAKVDVPFGHLTNCLHTQEWTLLEHDREHKFYCPGVGLVEEVHPAGGHITNELLSMSHF